VPRMHPCGIRRRGQLPAHRESSYRQPVFTDNVVSWTCTYYAWDCGNYRRSVHYPLTSTPTSTGRILAIDRFSQRMAPKTPKFQMRTNYPHPKTLKNLIIPVILAFVIRASGETTDSFSFDIALRIYSDVTTASALTKYLETASAERKRTFATRCTKLKATMRPTDSRRVML
jgi:hypothetical protein